MLALVALFCAGYLAPYLLPSLVGRLGTDFGLTPTQAGGVGSALLLASALAGIGLTGRISRLGPDRIARCALVVVGLGYGLAAVTHSLPLLLTGCVLGGAGSGASTAVAASVLAKRPDPHRVFVIGLLVTSALAAGIFLVLPHLGTGHGLAFASIAVTGALALPTTSGLPGRGGHRLPVGGGEAAARAVRLPLPRRGAGITLALCLMLWSLTQNALWGVSGRIGLDRAGLTEAVLGVVLAAALGAGLVGTVGAGLVGSRFGTALPIGAGTLAIAACVALTGAAHHEAPFAFGEIAWNAVYPFVLSYLLGLAATLDREGRWGVLAGAASSIGVACGPLAGTLLVSAAGYPAMGVTLAAVLLAVAGPLVTVARNSAKESRAEAARTTTEPVPVPAPRGSGTPTPDPDASSAAA
ncbi:MFS transporter [Streptacidiphilus jiangxiensis]|uniref:Predicted arabinose efflux permease, MFS family n=1 Tax=Streptacidiphilus jiangxiensis TaxID=235985 RepID=A0A1H7RYL4_STRJI|nr:MFS transporter [Streptacidiphilus jiangxiensis]SEL64744.1 Predicted arabinose efflux permease, MFS family [Streptacidiphilus jiangxiensis]